MVLWELLWATFRSQIESSVFFLGRSAARSGWSMLVENCPDEKCIPSRSPGDIDCVIAC